MRVVKELWNRLLKPLSFLLHILFFFCLFFYLIILCLSSAKKKKKKSLGMFLKRYDPLVRIALLNLCSFNASERWL